MDCDRRDVAWGQDVFTREKTKLFLEQQVEGFNAMLKVKDESFQKFVVDRGLKTEELLVGKLPDFEVSKNIQMKLGKYKIKSAKGTTSKSKKGGSYHGDITTYLNSGLTSKQLNS